MRVPKWLTLAAVLAGTAGLAAQQAGPKRPRIDPVTVAEFAGRKAIVSRYDPDLWWISHGDVWQTTSPSVRP